MKHETEQVITVIQGDFAISDGPQVVLTTVLGSCIAVCLHDRNRRIGGMNHFLLAGGGTARAACAMVRTRWNC